MAGGTSSFNNIMLWAAATTTFFSFCRSGETTVPSDAKYDPEVHLSYSDLAVDNASVPQVISIQLKTSKTDQCRRGYKVVLGRTNNCLCPVSALLSYLSLRGSSPGPLFHWQNKTPLSKPKFVEQVSPDFLLHPSSFRSSEKYGLVELLHSITSCCGLQQLPPSFLFATQVKQLSPVTLSMIQRYMFLILTSPLTMHQFLKPFPSS